MKAVIVLLTILMLLGCSPNHHESGSPFCPTTTYSGKMCRDNLGYCRCWNYTVDCHGFLLKSEDALTCGGNCDEECPEIKP